MKYIGQKVTIKNNDGTTDQGRIVSAHNDNPIVIRRDHKLHLGKEVFDYIRSKSNDEETFYLENNRWWNKPRTSEITSL